MTHTIILAAGGTGGHIFPAEALAEELLKRGHTPVFVTDARSAGYATGVLSTLPTHTITAGRMGGGVVAKLKALLGVARGTWQARRIIKQLKPYAVVGFGGYPSFPTMLAATLLGARSVVHEQNAVLGRANRVLAGRVDVIATSAPLTQFLREEDAPKVVHTGNPVRLSVRALHEVPYPEMSNDGAMRLLVTGGSQGAAVFSDILPKALELLPTGARARLRVDQQCRPQELNATRAAYQAIGVNADLATFFADIPARLASAHLVIARAGASTVAELTAAGRPSILVPLPTAMDNHQAVNANALEESGAAWVIPQEAFTPAAIAARLEAFLSLPSSLTKAAAAARAMGRIDAAQQLADVVLGERADSLSKAAKESAASQQSSFAARSVAA